MKGDDFDKQKREIDKLKSQISQQESKNIQQQASNKGFSEMDPFERDRFIKQEIGKKIKQNQLSKIRNMSISEANDVADRDVDVPFYDTNRQNQIRYLNSIMGVTEESIQGAVKSPGQKHLELMEQGQKLKRIKRRQYRTNPIWSQIKRGKLGIDNFFILFGMLGSILIPVYVFNKFKKNRQAIIDSRIAPPEVIKRLEPDSPIQLEDVNHHVIMYYNPDRIKENQIKRHFQDEKQKLERELYF